MIDILGITLLLSIVVVVVDNNILLTEFLSPVPVQSRQTININHSISTTNAR